MVFICGLESAGLVLGQVSGENSRSHMRSGRGPLGRTQDCTCSSWGSQTSAGVGEGAGCENCHFEVMDGQYSSCLSAPQSENNRLKGTRVLKSTLKGEEFRWPVEQTSRICKEGMFHWDYLIPSTHWHYCSNCPFQCGGRDGGFQWINWVQAEPCGAYKVAFQGQDSLCFK